MAPSTYMQTTNNEPLGAGLVSTLPELLCRTTERASQNTLCANPQPGWSQGSKETQLPDLAPLRALPGWWRSQRVYPLCWDVLWTHPLPAFPAALRKMGTKLPALYLAHGFTQQLMLFSMWAICGYVG